MNVLVAVNDKYLVPLSVMLYSLAVNNSTSINVYVLHFDIEAHAQDVFERKIAKWKQDVKIQFCQVDKSLFKDMSQNKRYRHEANLRLAMLEVLPINIERILWLDVDIIIKGNLVRFYNYPNHGQYALVCKDMAPKVEKNDILKQLGMNVEKDYFNSGVMLLYLNNLRKHASTHMFIEWMKNNPDKLRYPDQNVLNVFLENKVVWAKSEVYNLQLLRVYDDSSDLLKCAKIVHYNTQKKPWNAEYDGLGCGLFWAYGITTLPLCFSVTFLVGRLKNFFRKMK